MDERALSLRRKALEETFFSRLNEQLLQTLKSAAHEQEQKDQLAAVSGIKNDDLLNRLIARGIDAPTWAAVSLVPLVEVAWADGKLEPNERDAILQAAEQSGLEPDSSGHVLLKEWLKQKPDLELHDSWKQYISEYAKDIDSEVKPIFRESVLGRARTVAEAAGGFLGLGSKVSAAEQQVLDDLESAMQ
jgi:hypothetical protein